MNVQRANPDLIPLDSKPIQNFQISRTCLVPQTMLTVQQKKFNHCNRDLFYVYDLKFM